MLYKLTRSAFLSILDEFQDVRRKVDVIYKERMEKVAKEEAAIKLGVAQQLSQKVLFLNRKNEDIRYDEYLKRLSDTLIPVFFSPGEVIFEEGTIGRDMFFVKTGSVEVIIPGGKSMILNEGSFFGEAALVANLPRKHTKKAVTACTLYRLSRNAFMELISDFEDKNEKVVELYNEEREKMENEIEEFEQHMLIERKTVQINLPAVDE
ncbi:hypothetical protein HK100_010157 [Physocladia obscura]|uniref:Cyclic nucleotide-binding domain-containing protein n=1 Tax=Physocladia obscura TaxID=109957 RepID=A0AAD5X730_9FUNG|nr:hypothetical protein HK100_010157 [Physocladia obscura]